MRWLVLACTISSFIGHCAARSARTSFYVVSAFFSDHGAALYYRLIEVSPDGPDSLVRYSRVASVNIYCPRMVVQSAGARLRNTSPAGLLQDNDPCAVKPATLRSRLSKYHRRLSYLEAFSFAVVAHCGSRSVLLELPTTEGLDFDALKTATLKRRAYGICLNKSSGRRLERTTFFTTARMRMIWPSRRLAQNWSLSSYLAGTTRVWPPR